MLPDGRLVQCQSELPGETSLWDLPTGPILSYLDPLRCSLAGRQEGEPGDLFGPLPALGFQADVNIWGMTVAEDPSGPEPRATGWPGLVNPPGANQLVELQIATHLAAAKITHLMQ